jgi:hypothetical protein
MANSNRNPGYNLRDNDVTLLDLLSPLIVRWKILAIGLAATFAICALVLFLTPREWIARTDFVTESTDYSTFDYIIKTLALSDRQEAFFEHGNLGVDAGRYFVPPDSDMGTMKSLGYFSISYSSSMLDKDGTDFFKGYRDDKKNLIQSPQTNFDLQFKTYNPDAKVAQQIGERILRQYIATAWIESSIERLAYSRLANNVPAVTSQTASPTVILPNAPPAKRKPIDLSAPVSLADLKRDLERQNNIIKQLSDFQREFPSLIRSNLTLNENTIPVEVQLMNARQEVLAINEDISDYFRFKVRHDAYQVFLSNIRDIKLEGYSKDLQKDYFAKLRAAVDSSFVCSPEAISSAPEGANLKDSLDTEKADFLGHLDTFELSLATNWIGSQVTFLPIRRNFATFAIIIGAGIMSSILALYAINAVQLVRRRMREEE